MTRVKNVKSTRKFIASLGEVEEPTYPFEVVSIDITGPYPTTARKNKYLLTFIDHFTKYTEAFPLQDQRAETCARVYATQIVTRHGTGSKLITDQGRAFMSFFKETCKILGICKTNTTSYHPESNGMIERLHRVLHAALSHYVNTANTNWDILVPFFLMAHRATPHSTTKHSPFFLLHGREMILPSQENLKARVSGENIDQKQRLGNLKTSLKNAYKAVAIANKRSHRNNKQQYDRKAKLRNFQVGELAYLYNPAMKPGRSRKFYRPWTGPFKITKKISDLNYEITDPKDKKQVVHVNRLKLAENSELWKPKTRKKPEKKREILTEENDETEDSMWKLKSLPLAYAGPSANSSECEPSLGQSPIHTPTDTPIAVNQDPTYQPPDSPRSRRELQSTRTEPPVTRSRTRIVSS